MAVCGNSITPPPNVNDNGGVWLQLCDDNGVFLRQVKTGDDGSPESVTDYTLDGQPYTPVGDVGSCDGSTLCEQQTTPVSTTGLCLADGTPIATVATRDCDGVLTQTGWLNLLTGAYSDGAPPAGTMACGNPQSIQVSGTFCDVDTDGNVLGLVLVEYHYAVDGSIDTVRLVDATTGDTYTLQGQLTVCPAGVEEPEQDLVVLCDTAADGTATRFVRDYRRDENGAIVGHADYTLDGAAYTAVGTVQSCDQVDGCTTASVQVLHLCDLNPDVEPDDQGRRCATPFLRHVIYGCDGAIQETRDTTVDGSTAYTPVNVIDCSGGVPALVELVWPQTGIAEDPDLPGGQDFIYTVTNPDSQDEATIHVHVSQPAGGACGEYDPEHPVFNNASSYTLDLSPEAQAAMRFRLDFNDLDNFEGVNNLTPRPDSVVFENGTGTYDPATGDIRTNESANPGPTVYAYWNTPPETITWSTRNVGGGASCTTVAFQAVTLKPDGCCTGCGDGGEQSCQAFEVCRCDDTDGDGLPDTSYTEVWSVPCDGGTPTLSWTYADDPGTSYMPVSPVPCDQGDAVTAVQAHRVEVAAGGTWDIAAHPLAQSVTLTNVSTAPATITTTDGDSSLYPGESVSFSVTKDSDPVLTGPLTVAPGTGSTVTVQWTELVTA